MRVFFTYPSTFARPRKARWMVTLVAWGLVTFYLLASARALVPGLCATQAAMTAQSVVTSAAGQISAPGRSCCVPFPLHTNGTGRRIPVTPAESHCAFCNLLIAHTDPPMGLVYVDLPMPAHAAQPLPALQLAPEVPRAAAPNRPPPV